jgi:rhodanese-related sulfurtransferase
MDGNPLTISPTDLYGRLANASAPVLIDVRRGDSFLADDRLIIGALRRSPTDVEHWRRELPAGRPVVAYCGHGGQSSQSVVNALRAAGVDALYLEGGVTAWRDASLPMRKKLPAAERAWVTREHPKIDRIACPWLISRFINPNAQFVYVPASEVLSVAEKTGATPYDIKGAEFGHVGDHCSFDAIVRIFDIHDRALDHLATIVRGADTSRPDLAPQCEGLLAISYGLSANFPDDHEMLRHGLVMYDALYAWCRLQQAAARAPAAKATA